MTACWAQIPSATRLGAGCGGDAGQAPAGAKRCGADGVAGAATWMGALPGTRSAEGAGTKADDVAATVLAGRVRVLGGSAMARLICRA